MRCRFLQLTDFYSNLKKLFQVAGMLQGSQIHWKMETSWEPLDPCADFNPLVSKAAVEEDDSKQYARNRQRSYSTSVVR